MNTNQNHSDDVYLADEKITNNKINMPTDSSIKPNESNEPLTPNAAQRREDEDFDENNSNHCCLSPCSRPSCCKKISIGKYALGIFLILCVTVIWVAASAWIQYIFGELEYKKPYFLTYFNTAGFTLWNLGYIFVRSWRRVPWNNTETPEPIIFIDSDLKEIYTNSSYSTNSIPLSNSNKDNKINEEVPVAEIMNQDKTTPFTSEPIINEDAETLLPPHSDKKLESLKPYSLFKIFICACSFCPFWFLANYLFNLSLSRTSVASNTVLSSTSSIWTLLLSVLFLGQRLTYIKVGAVILCVGGSVMIAFSDGKSALDGDSVIGDILALISAFFYAIYTSVLKWFLPDDERYRMGMTFGMVGVINLVCLWPGLPILNKVGFETFQLPTLQQLWPLVINTLIGTNLSDVLWARSVVLTSPIVATLGLSLTTPLAMVVDAVWKKAHFPPLYITGAILVMVGFILVNLDGSLTLSCMRRSYRRLKL